MSIKEKTKKIIQNATKSDLIEMSISLLEVPMMGGFEEVWSHKLECFSVLRMISLQEQNPTDNRRKEIDTVLARLKKEGVLA
jgi:hypothetical protein